MSGMISCKMCIRTLRTCAFWFSSTSRSGGEKARVSVGDSGKLASEMQVGTMQGPPGREEFMKGLYQPGATLGTNV